MTLPIYTALPEIQNKQISLYSVSDGYNELSLSWFIQIRLSPLGDKINNPIYFHNWVSWLREGAVRTKQNWLDLASDLMTVLILFGVNIESAHKYCLKQSKKCLV